MFKKLLFLILFTTISFPQIKIKAVGDIMLGSITPRKILPSDSGRTFIKNVSGYLKDADIIFGNLEGSFLTNSVIPIKCTDSSRSAGKCYEFGMPLYLSPVLSSLGFSVINMDNNHSEDFGNKNYLGTIDLLNDDGIHVIGRKNPIVINIKNNETALIGFGFSPKSYNVNDIPYARKLVKYYKEKYNYVIVSFHGGKEGNSAIHIKDESEIFYGEKRGNIVQFARAVVDAGADLVLGHGPHVLRALELYKGKLIVYSLGNFLTYGNFGLSGNTGITCILEVELDAFGNFLTGNIIPFKQRNPGIPYYDIKNSAINLIQDLNKVYGSDKKIEVSSSGKINVLKK